MRPLTAFVPVQEAGVVDVGVVKVFAAPVLLRVVAEVEVEAFNSSVLLVVELKMLLVDELLGLIYFVPHQALHHLHLVAFLGSDLASVSFVETCAGLGQLHLDVINISHFVVVAVELSAHDTRHRPARRVPLAKRGSLLQRCCILPLLVSGDILEVQQLVHHQARIFIVVLIFFEVAVLRDVASAVLLARTRRRVLLEPFAQGLIDVAGLVVLREAAVLLLGLRDEALGAREWA